MKKIIFWTLFILGLPLSAFAQTSANNSFVPLTSIPGLTQGASATPSLPTFLNGLYFICIGIAVVLTVLQLIRAGITYMTASGNIGSTEEAKHLISASLLGLLLVLSPYIVFSVINPKILTLDISSSVNKLQSSSPGTTNTGGSTNPTAGNTSDSSNSATQSSSNSTAPGAPSNLQVTSQTSNSASLSWSAPSGGTPPTAYHVQVDGQDKTSVAGTSATIANLSSGSHTFSVTAVDANGNVSSASNSKSATITAESSAAQDGSEGMWVYSEWRDHRNESCSTGYPCTTACYVYVETSYPVPFEGRDKTAMQAGCQTALQSDQQENQGETYHDSFFNCTFLTAGQQLTKPAAPGPVCATNSP